MKSQELKTCPKCQACVPGGSATCLYCSAPFVSVAPSSSVEDSLYSKYTPPYSARKESADVVEQTVPYTAAVKTVKVEETGSKEAKKETLLPVLTLSLATNLVLFAAFLAIFAENGRLSLSWSAQYWGLYMVFSLPLFLYGFKKISTLE